MPAIGPGLTQSRLYANSHPCKSISSKIPSLEELSDGENFFALGKEVFEFQCIFRRSSKARRINIRVTEPRKIILTLPNGVSRETGKEFVKKQGAWIRKNSLLVPRRQTLASYLTKGSEVCIEDVSKKR